MDQAAFDALFHQSFSRLCAQIEAMCGDAAEAQDCVQEAFIRAWQHREELSRYGSPEGWVRKVASNQAVSRWRKHGKRRATMPEEIGLPHGSRSDDQMALDQALAQLKPEPRRAVVLHYMVGLPIKDIAEEMDVAVNTVKTWLSRSRTTMARFLDPQEVPDA